MSQIRILSLIWLGKMVAKISRLFNFGGGSTWPGHLALKISPQITSLLSSQIKKGIILVAGTNGKTTTAKMIQTILGSKTFHNESGANLLNGLVSSLILASDWKGKLPMDWAVFEVDEATLPSVLEKITPKFLVILNLFRDQLDRYGEIDLIAEKWRKSFTKLPASTQLILNADDPQIAHLGNNLKAKVAYFGLDDQKITLKEKQHAMDTTHCPSCGTKLTFSRIYFSHLGEWHCPKCHVSRPKVDLKEWNYPLPGVYNRYNTLAAVLAAKKLGVDKKQIQASLRDFKPAFGRQEKFETEGKKIKILLAKNPTGLNESIRTLAEKGRKKTVIIALNDKIPDGRDVSWIWDVDFEPLIRNTSFIIAGGIRAADLALRLKYAGTPRDRLIIEEDFSKAIKIGIEKIENDETLFVLPTYSAMLEVRKVISGRKIL